jgi:8-oxo-dGTP pyrophosphatase MutT (NUDIX family)
MKKEFTASVYLIDNQKVLLIYHYKLQKWLPPGGHVEANETPAEAARREVREETGLEIEFISQENLQIDCWNAKSIERPYLCLLEDIPSYQNIPAHQHVDFIYIAKPIEECHSPAFSSRWFSWNDLQSLLPDKEIFNETLQVIEHLFHVFSSPQVPVEHHLSKMIVNRRH